MSTISGKRRMWSRIRAWRRASALRSAASIVLGVLTLLATVDRLVAQRSGPDTGPADLIINNGKVYPGDRGSFEQAIAVRGNRIVAVGTGEAIGKLRGETTQVIDAQGAAVVPGFNDVHTHILSGGLEMDNVNLQGAQTLEDIQQRIRAFASEHADRTWIRGRGWGYGPFPGVTPTREQLDAVVADRPAVMRCFDGHSLWVNSKALAAAGITRDTPDPPNGTIVRDGA